MEVENLDLEGFKYKPVLNRSNYCKDTFSEGLKFKKGSIYKPVVSCIDSIYMSKVARVKKKNKYLKPFERKHLLTIAKPILGRKVKYTKRSESVVPGKKEPVNFNKFDDLTLPILSMRRKKIRSRS